jgi:hypothetical protein
MIRRGMIPIALTLTLVAATFGAPPPDDKKLKAEELIARHVESIGSKEAQAAVKSRVASGPITLVVRVGGSGKLEGEGIFGSTGNKLRLSMRFSATDYSGENLAFDGSKTATGFLPNGTRSRLSAFVIEQDETIKEGLIGGVLSTAWPLLRIAELQPRLDYKGLKKVGGREMHEASYRPRKGSGEMKVLLYFDSATFRHVSTHYSYVRSASIGINQSSNANTESLYSLIEEFDDFREVGGLMLPHKYRIQVSIQSGNNRGTALHDYSMTVNNIQHNRTLDDKVFTLK